MEFKYRAVQNQQTPTPMSHPVTYVSDRSLHGSEFAPGNFPTNVMLPNGFQTPVPINAREAIQRELEKQQIRREIEKEEIRREIIAKEIAWRRELENEVRKEIVLGISMQKPEGFLLQPPGSMSLNQNMKSMNNTINSTSLIGGPQPQLHPKDDTRQLCVQTNYNKEIIQAKLDPDFCGAKHKAMTPAVDVSEHLAFSLQKKLKQDWSCALCQVSATSENGLNDHLRGKKHKAKEIALRSKRIGLDARLDSQTTQPCITAANTSIVEPRKEDHAGKKNQGLDGVENENEITTEKETGETNALTTKKKFKFWCAICEVGTYSEIVMQDHKIGKKHLAKMKKFSQHNGALHYG
ncbi:Zinc finger protein, partial [Mucuna pruriens]